MKKILLILLILIFSITILTACKSNRKQDDTVIAASDAEKDDKNQEQEQVKETDKIDPNENELEKNEIQPDIEIVDSNEQNHDITSDEQVDVSQPTETEIDRTESDDTPKLKTEIRVENYEVDYSNIEKVGNLYGASDCFVGKITDSEKITISKETYDKYFDESFSDEYKDKHYFKLNEDFNEVVFPLNAELYIYTVKVEQSIFSIFTEANTTIKVLADVSDMDIPYEVGEKYLMKGTLYQYNGETVIRLLDQLKAKVNDEGALIGLSKDAKIFETVKTVSEFISNSSVEGIFEKEIAVPKEFSQSYGVPEYELVTADKHKDTLDKIIADGKKAIIADSDFKMNLERKDEVK